MLLLIDENVPDSVARVFQERGHDVRLVRELFASATPDPVIATLGDQLGAIIVSWDRDFESLIRRIPVGNRRRFRRLGRINFRCNEVRGAALAAKWMEAIEFHYGLACKSKDFRMILDITETTFKAM